MDRLEIFFEPNKKLLQCIVEGQKIPYDVR